MPDSDNLTVSRILNVNDETRQHSNTADMIFSCRKIICYIAKHMTLEPGDMIIIGILEGVIMDGPEHKRIWIKDGDEVTVTMELRESGQIVSRP